jgi:hypothetical protein
MFEDSILRRQEHEHVFILRGRKGNHGHGTRSMINPIATIEMVKSKRVSLFSFELRPNTKYILGEIVMVSGDTHHLKPGAHSTSGDH